MRQRPYVRDGAEIYRQSFATIRAEADLARLPADVAQVAVRMIHACGHGRPGRRPRLLARRRRRGPRRAAQAGAPDPLRRRRWSPPASPAARLPADNDVVCTLHDPRVPELAAQLGTTRSAAALELWRRPARRRGRRDRQRADRAVPPARADRRRRAAAGRGPRHPGRVHRRRRVQGRAGRTHRTWSTWWCAAGAAAARSPRRRSTRSRARRR